MSGILCALLGGTYAGAAAAEPPLFASSLGPVFNTDVNQFWQYHSVATHGISNGQLVGTVLYGTSGISAKRLIGWCYDLTTGVIAYGASQAVAGTSNFFGRVAGNGASGMTYLSISTNHTLRGYSITNYATVTTALPPSITVSGTVNTPFTGSNSGGGTGMTLTVDRSNGQYVFTARIGNDTSTYGRITYTHPSTYTAAFTANNLGAGAAARGRGLQQLIAIPGSTQAVWVADDANGNNTFTNTMGSTSELGLNFYGSALGANGQAVLISHSGSANAASATVIATGTIGASANSYRFRQVAVTSQAAASYSTALTTVTLTNGLADYRILTYKPNTSTDYLVMYRNGNILYLAKVSLNGATKIEYGSVVDTGGFNTWSASEAIVNGADIYHAHLLTNGSSGKIAVTKFSG
jgi:hypothetical protein